MANSAQSRKRVRQTAKRRTHNTGLRTSFRTAVKKIIKAIETGDKELAESTFHKSVKTIDSMARKGVYHQNKAARHKSRLSEKIKNMA